MKEIVLTVVKSQVYDEVAKTTSYTGDKMADESAYDRIFTTDEDAGMLERFWNESKNMACNNLKKLLVFEGEHDGVYNITLDLSSSYDDALTGSMQRSLFSFFVMNITSKWYNIANKEDAVAYAGEAAGYMDDVMRKCLYKKKPVRPTYN